MAIYGVEFTITYIAWDTANNAGKTGDAANHTLRWIKDGTAAAPTNTPVEVDAANAPGVYKLTLTGTEAQATYGTLAGKSSTSGVSIMPVSVAFERLPNAAPGSQGGLPVLDAALRIKADAEAISGSTAAADSVEANIANLDAAVSTRLATSDARLNNLDATVSSRLAASDTRLDNLDAAITSRAPASTALSNTVWTDTKAGYIDAAISSRLASTSYVVPPAAADIWSHATRTLTAFGFTVTVGANNDKTGYSLTADYDRAKTALASTEYVTPDNAGITAIRQQTDKLQFSTTSLVLADMTALNGDTTATSNLGKVYGAIESGTVAASASNSPTKFRVSFTVDAEKHAGRFLMFSAGAANQGQIRKITSVDTASNALTLNAALDTTPAAGDEFVLIGYGAS